MIKKGKKVVKPKGEKAERKGKVIEQTEEQAHDLRPPEEKKTNENAEENEGDPEVKLYMVDYNQCDPSKCSGRKLENFGLLKNIIHKSRFRGITLSASGKKYVSKEDKEIILKYGLCVIDCSWNKIEELHSKTHFDHERILPFMIATNPINFGAPYKLSCAEALAAALFICDFWDQGMKLMEKFKWGPGFLTHNKGAFELYEDCETYEDLQKAEAVYLENAKKEREDNRSKRLLPPSDSESDDEEEPVYIPKDDSDEENNKGDHNESAEKKDDDDNQKETNDNKSDGSNDENN